MTTMDYIRAQMEAMHANVKAEHEKTALAQRNADAKQEAGRLRGEIVTLSTEPSASRGSGTGIGTQQPLVSAQARRFERLRGRPERAGDLNVAEWVADMRYHLTCNQMSKMAGCAPITEHPRGMRFLEGDPGRSRGIVQGTASNLW